MAKMKKMRDYRGSMISEDMSAPGNLPQNVVRRQYGTGYEVNYDYQGNSDAMYKQEMDDIMVLSRSKAKRRY
jgi:hypothetical protein